MRKDDTEFVEEKERLWTYISNSCDRQYLAADMNRRNDRSVYEDRMNCHKASLCGHLPSLLWSVSVCGPAQSHYKSLLYCPISSPVQRAHAPSSIKHLPPDKWTDSIPGSEDTRSPKFKLQQPHYNKPLCASMHTWAQELLLSPSAIFAWLSKSELSTKIWHTRNLALEGNLMYRLTADHKGVPVVPGHTLITQCTLALSLCVPAGRWEKSPP